MQRHAFGRRWQTSQRNTTSRTFLAIIIHSLVTMLAKMNRPSAFSKANSAVQVDRPPRDWIQKSGAESRYMCSPTLSRLHHSLSKFSTNLFQYDVTILYRTPLILFGTGNLFVKSGINQGILPRTNMIPFFQRVRELGGLISFLDSNKRSYVHRYSLVARTF